MVVFTAGDRTNEGTNYVVKTETSAPKKDKVKISIETQRPILKSVNLVILLRNCVIGTIKKKLTFVVEV